MRKGLHSLASLRLTLAGMFLLAIGAALSYDNPVHTPVWVLVVPMAVLALNLFAAILTNPRIYRRRGLLIFHLGLLAVVILAGIGRLTHFEGHLELLQDTAFAAGEVYDRKAGPLHDERLKQLRFVQGSYTVEYAPGIVRGRTRSVMHLLDEQGRWETRVIGDDTPLVLDGYRFYTTYNKGFAPILTWVPLEGSPQTGSIHMPSYPLYEYKQDSTWTPPGGPEIRFWLRLDTGMREDAAWLLDGAKAKGLLVVNTGDARTELGVGESVQLPGGTLRYERLSTWMGYKVFYDPTLHWMFAASVIGILGMAWHFRSKFAAQSPGRVNSGLVQNIRAATDREGKLA